jgi:hypothetical protein
VSKGISSLLHIYHALIKIYNGLTLVSLVNEKVHLTKSFKYLMHMFRGSTFYILSLFRLTCYFSDIIQSQECEWVSHKECYYDPIQFGKEVSLLSWIATFIVKVA